MVPNPSSHPQVILHGSLAQNLVNRELSYKHRPPVPTYHTHQSLVAGPYAGAHSSNQQQLVASQPSPAQRDRSRSGGQKTRDMVWVDSKERLSEMATDIRGISSALSNVALAVPVSRIMILSKLSDYEIEDKVKEVITWLLNWTAEDEDNCEGDIAVYEEGGAECQHRHHSHHYSNRHHFHHTHPHQKEKNPAFTEDESFSGALSRCSSASSSYMNLEVARTVDADAKKRRQSSIGKGRRELSSERKSCTTGKLVVYVQDLLVNRGVVTGPEFDVWRREGRLKTWKNTDVSEQADHIDLIITLGGDGTVLYNSWLFQKMVPPTLSFALGSLGFMTENQYKDFRKVLDHSLTHGICCTLRMRFQCEVMRTKNPEKDGTDDLREEIWQGGQNSHFTTHTVDGTYTILNEAVVDRGPNPFVTMTELYGDFQLLTSIKADGVVISTPTGSTAYSMSAGGSLVHPDIPARLISPICPHTLSFRPLVVPDSMALHIGVPYDARSSAFVSFDGKQRVELRRGDFMSINVSRYPFPKVLPPNSTNVTWVQQLSKTLHWNEQKRPKRYTDGSTDNYMQE